MTFVVPVFEQVNDRGGRPDQFGEFSASLRGEAAVD